LWYADAIGQQPCRTAQDNLDTLHNVERVNQQDFAMTTTLLMDVETTLSASHSCRSRKKRKNLCPGQTKMSLSIPMTKDGNVFIAAPAPAAGSGSSATNELGTTMVTTNKKRKSLVTSLVTTETPAMVEELEWLALRSFACHSQPSKLHEIATTTAIPSPRHHRYLTPTLWKNKIMMTTTMTTNRQQTIPPCYPIACRKLACGALGERVKIRDNGRMGKFGPQSGYMVACVAVSYYSFLVVRKRTATMMATSE